MPRRELGTEVLWYIIFLSPPPSEKRKTKSARPQEKRQEDPGSLHEDGEMPESVSSYGGVATLREETEERSCLEEKKTSRINLERKVGSQEDQSSGKLSQQHSRKQEIGQEGAPKSFERSTFLEES